MEAVCLNSGKCTDQQELDAFTEVEESLRDVTYQNKRASIVESEIPGNHSSNLLCGMQVSVVIFDMLISQIYIACKTVNC